MFSRLAPADSQISHRECKIRCSLLQLLLPSSLYCLSASDTLNTRWDRRWNWRSTDASDDVTVYSAYLKHGTWNLLCRDDLRTNYRRQ